MSWWLKTVWGKVVSVLGVLAALYGLIEVGMWWQGVKHEKQQLTTEVERLNVKVAKLEGYIMGSNDHEERISTAERRLTNVEHTMIQIGADMEALPMWSLRTRLNELEGDIEILDRPRVEVGTVNSLGL